MEGLKPMVDKAMGGNPFAAPKGTMPGDYMPGEDKICDQCGKWIESDNTGTVCGACTQSMLGMGGKTEWIDDKTYVVHDEQPAFHNPNDYGASKLSPNSHVGLHLNGHNMNVSVYRSLQGLADDLINSMLPDEVRLLVSLLTGDLPKPPALSNALPPEFWEAIKANKKIPAIKELRAVSTLNLKAAKDIVEAIMNKPEPEDKDKDKSEDKDESDESEDKDDDESDKDDSGDKPEDSEPDYDAKQDEYEAQEAEEGDSDGDGADADEFGDDGGDGEGGSAATMDALADLAKRAHDNGKEHSEDEIRKALATLGIQF